MKNAHQSIRNLIISDTIDSALAFIQAGAMTPKNAAVRRSRRGTAISTNNPLLLQELPIYTNKVWRLIEVVGNLQPVREGGR